MHLKDCLLFAAAVFCLFYGKCVSQNSHRSGRATRFTCQGRGSGYYADIETGCQVYHMCDGLGRQFSYSCPNTTLFQQRMLICDHWYMVNCSSSESAYSANLLIGQRDKPFVSDSEMSFRTPRPDILSVPPNNNYYDGLKEAETKFAVHPDNNIVGLGDSTSHSNNNGLDSAKHHYRPPTSWSTGTANKNNQNTYQNIGHTNGNANHFGLNNDRISASNNRVDSDNLAGAASQEVEPTFQPNPNHLNENQNTRPSQVLPPSQDLSPPIQEITTEASEEFDLDVRMKNSSEDPVYKFIKRFDPNSPESHKTAMSTSEIININSQLPAGPDASGEDERTPRKHKNADNNVNTLHNKDKNQINTTRFNSVNLKPAVPSLENNSSIAVEDNNRSAIKEPERILLPPKLEQSELPSTTMGPIIYYEWKWAVPAFDLEPPKPSNVSSNLTEIPQGRNISPFRSVTRPPPREVRVNQPNTEYNTSSYFVPDYVFPLDKEHPGYGNDSAQTSFQVNVSRPGRASFGENPACPQCHPAYLKPGTCEPCIMQR